jgi:hypothetical protein
MRATLATNPPSKPRGKIPHRKVGDFLRFHKLYFYTLLTVITSSLSEGNTNTTN